MKRSISKSLGSIIALSIALTSCKKEDTYTYSVGNPTVTVESEYEAAFFGDSLTFSVQVADNEIPLSTVKAQLYYTDDMVSETIIRTKENGQYTGKIYVPFYKNVPNGTATLKFVVQNISKKTAEQDIDLELSRPDYPYLTLVTADGEYQMDKVGPNQYEATDAFPLSVKAYIKAPKFGVNGNALTFGWVNNEIVLGSTTDIPFSYSSPGMYPISFNTLTFEGSPFITPTINGTSFSRLDDEHFQVDIELTEGEEITIEGFEDLASWWIDSDFFTDNGSGNLSFNAMTGKYRITADITAKYFAVEVMNGSELARLNADGTGTIWIIGDGIGKPSVHTNQIGWNPGKALSMAPKGNKTYQVTLVGDKTAYKDYLNFKFFHQKDWGGEFNNNSISTGSDIIFVGNGPNGRDPGNIGLLAGKELEEDGIYIITIDLSGGNDNAVLTMTKQ